MNHKKYSAASQIMPEESTAAITLVGPGYIFARLKRHLINLHANIGSIVPWTVEILGEYIDL